MMKADRSTKKCKCLGVTLIELMITVAILGIIMAIAYPSYQSFMMEARRADAQGALVGFAAAMERYFTVNGTYCGAGPGTVAACNDGTPDAAVFESQAPLDGDKYYNLSLTSMAASSYTVNAAPITGSAQADDSCGTMTIDHTGTRTSTSGDCWR